jgi:hypothetical protein
VKTYEVLEKALSLIEDEQNWCRNQVETDAGRRCAVGAVEVAGIPAERLVVDHSLTALDLLAARADGAGISLGCLLTEHAVELFNDCLGHAPTVALFKEAIRNEKANAGVHVDLPAPVAQPVERRICNPDAAGSIPVGGSLLGGGER